MPVGDDNDVHDWPRQSDWWSSLRLGSSGRLERRPGTGCLASWLQGRYTPKNFPLRVVYRSLPTEPSHDLPARSCWSSFSLDEARSVLPASPHSLDSRLVFEQIAREPAIVTPTGLAVDSRGRVLVIEGATLISGPRTTRAHRRTAFRIFEDADGDGRFESVSTFFEGTKLTMSLAFARDRTLFVATRNALYRLTDRDGDGKADGELAARLPTPIVRLDTPGDYPHNGLSGFAFDPPATSISAWARTWVRATGSIGSDGTTLVRRR